MQNVQHAERPQTNAHASFNVSMVSFHMVLHPYSAIIRLLFTSSFFLPHAAGSVPDAPPSIVTASDGEGRLLLDISSAPGPLLVPCFSQRWPPSPTAPLLLHLPPGGWPQPLPRPLTPPSLPPPPTPPWSCSSSAAWWDGCSGVEGSPMPRPQCLARYAREGQGGKHMPLSIRSFLRSLLSIRPGMVE
jgi:hypothetical protein